MIDKQSKLIKYPWITLSASVLAAVTAIGINPQSVWAEEFIEETSQTSWISVDEQQEIVDTTSEEIEETTLQIDSTEEDSPETSLVETSQTLSEELLEQNQEVINLNIELYGEVQGVKGDTPYTQKTVNSRRIYIVQPGDWVAKIAKMHGVTSEQIKAWNNLSSNLIHPHQELYVSGPDTSATDPTTHIEEVTETTTENKKPVANESNSSNRNLHTVQKGEYLWLIGQKYGISVDQIIKWNNLSSNWLKVGDRLVVSKPSTAIETPITAPTITSPTPTKPEINPVINSQKTHTVIPGDYLHKIASQYGVTVQNLKDWNQLSTNYIYAGDVLVVQTPNYSKPIVADTVKEEPKRPDLKPVTPIVNEVSQRKSHTVKSGDYLYKIASQYGISVQNLKDWNQLTSNYIYTGNVLWVQAPTTNPVVNQPTPVKGNDTDIEDVDTVIKRTTYTVRPGDSVNAISRKYNISPRQLMDWNKLSSYLIHPGNVLYVSALVEAVINEDDVPEDVLSEKINDLVEETLEESNVEFVMPKTHTVSSGEYLYLIASRYGITVDQLQRWNQLKSNYLYSGQKLIVSDPVNSVLVDGEVFNPSTVASNTVKWPNQVTPQAVAKQLNIPIMSQFDPRWKDARYGNDVSRTIWENGCAIVSLAMIDSYLQGEVINPADIADWAGLDHYIWGAGTAWSAFPAFAQERGYQINNHGRNVNAALVNIEKGLPALVSVRPGYFINGGHLMVVRGYDRATDTVYVNDPYDNPNRVKSNSTKGHSAKYLRQDTAGIWTFSKLR